MRINQRTHGRKEGAFTIPEVVIAALLLGISWISLSSAIANGYMILRSSRENLRATQIMLEQTEQLRMYKWPQLIALPQTQTTNYFDPSTKAPPIYTVTVSAPTSPNNLGAVTYQADLRSITVSVSWATENGKSNILHNSSMQTYVARSGMNLFVAR